MKKCPFVSEFGKWIECPHLVKADKTNVMEQRPVHCASKPQIGRNGAWCSKMIGKAMLVHKVFIGNDY